MEIGIRDAKNNLSKLVEAVLDGEEIFLTNRGERVAQLIPASKSALPGRGLGCLKGKVNFYPGWDSPEEDEKIAELFLSAVAGEK